MAGVSVVEIGGLSELLLQLVTVQIGLRVYRADRKKT